MKIRQIVLISLGLFLFLIIPNIAEARVIPCGAGACIANCDIALCNLYKTGADPNNFVHCPIECEICHLFAMVWKIAGFILYTIVPALAGLFLVFAGFKYFTAGIDNPSEAKNAKNIIISVILALLVLHMSLGFLAAFIHHIGDIPIYSHIQRVICGGHDAAGNCIPTCPVPAGFFPPGFCIYIGCH